MSNETGDDIEMSKRSKPETESNQTPHSESVVYPIGYQESEFEVLASNMMKKLSTSSLQEENAFVESTQKDMSKKKPVGHHFDEDAYRDIPEVTWPLHKIIYVGEHPEHVMRQEKVPVQLHNLILSNRTGVMDSVDQMSNGGMGPIGGMQLRDFPNPGGESVSRIGTMEVNLEDTVKQNHANIDGFGDVLNSNIGVLVVNLEKSEANNQNHPEKESGERAFSNFKPFIRDPPSCSKEECLNEPMVVSDAKNEQVAFWQHRIDISLFFDIMDVDKCHNAEISNSD